MELSPHRFLRRHPLLRDALLWAIPAILFGVVLRAMLLSYSPYAYWGSDSPSYFSFTYGLLGEGKLSLYDKRRYLYPIFLLPVTLLPGAALKWLAVLQHAFGLVTLVPLAYCVRKTFTHWRLWIVLVTVTYAGMPMILWYEHELLAENIFFAAVIWTIAGWCAWVNQPDAARAQRLWWWFFAGLAMFALIKPSARFLWLGVVLALAAVASWRVLRRQHWAALVGLFALSLTIGQDSQGAWLLYTSAFPLTRLDTPLHAEYKAEIVDLVQRARHRMESPDVEDATETKEWKLFLKAPEKQTERPLWQKLGADPKKQARLYRDLALEGIKARPDLFARISLAKIMGSANAAEFKSDRFEPGYFTEKFQHLYEREAEKKPYRMQLLLGLPKSKPMPSYEEITRRLAPKPDSNAAKALQQYAHAYLANLSFLDSKEDDVDAAPLTFTGWWVLAAVPLALLPTYFRQLGVWTIAMLGYLFGVFLVGGTNPRFFGPAWPVIVLLLAVPLDVVGSLLFSIWKARVPAKSIPEG